MLHEACRLGLVVASAVAVGIAAPPEAGAQGGSLLNKHLIIDDPGGQCSSTGTVVRLNPAKLVLFVARNGDTYYFFSDSTTEGVKAKLNKGPATGPSTTKYSSEIGGQTVSRKHRIQKTAEARADGSMLSFAYSYNHRGIWPNGDALTDQFSFSFVVTLLPGNGCALAERRQSRRLTTGARLLESYSCGPTLIPGSTCRIADGPPPQAR